MPPKAKFTKQKILETALNIVRESGIEVLSARTLGTALGCSPQPIFSYFENMEDVKNEVISAAKSIYAKYINEGLKKSPAFKGVGMKYIEFAKDEPKLFELLFMSDVNKSDIPNFLPAKDDNSPFILEAIMNDYNFDEERARTLYNHMAIYANGIAVLFAKNECIFNMEQVSFMLTDVFKAIFISLKNNNSNKSNRSDYIYA